MLPFVLIRHATLADAAAVAAIYNDGIAGHAATFETTPRSVADLERRLADVERYPVVVADAGASGVVGWAGLSEYRPARVLSRHRGVFRVRRVPTGTAGAWVGG